MTPQPSRLLLTFIWLSFFSACSQASAHTLKDSGVPASRDGNVAWFDNQRVVFYQMKVGKNNERLALEPFVWDTATQSVSPYPALQGSAQLRVCGEFLSYIRRKPGTDNEWLLVYGKIRDGQFVEDQVTEFPNPSAINPFNCRYYPLPYPWTVKGHVTTPLLEEHGYLDWGPEFIIDPFKPLDDSHLTLYRPGDQKGVVLPFRRRGLSAEVSYAPFRNTYLIPSGSYRDPATGEVQNSTEWPKGQPMPVWWLTPDGKVTEEAIPYHPFTTRAAGRGFLPVKGGVFAWSHAAGPGNSLGEAGGYLARDGTMRKVIAGLLRNPVVSPDGCKVAFVHEAQVPTPAAHGKMKMIDLCDGGGR